VKVLVLGGDGLLRAGRARGIWPMAATRCVIVDNLSRRKNSTSNLGVESPHPRIANLQDRLRACGGKPAASPFALCASTSPELGRACWSCCARSGRKRVVAFRRAARAPTR